MGELGGEILTPGSDTTLGGGALQWPLPVAGTITSPQGYRTDPITGETSYHSGTDIAVPEGTPILAAADGTVTIANALDSWGGSYGYHVKLDHGGGLRFVADDSVVQRAMRFHVPHLRADRPRHAFQRGDLVHHVRLEFVGGLVHIAAPESGQVAVRHMRPDHYLPRRRV